MAVAPAPSLRATQAGESRRRLVTAASHLFAQRGYAATSVAAIGEEAGVSRGLVNFHFATKANLLRAVVADLVAGLEAHMFPAPSPGASALASLAQLVDAHRRFVVEQPERARLLFRLQAEELNPALGLDDFAHLHDRWLERTSSWWESGLESGEIDPRLDHEATATVVTGALRGIALEWLLAPASVNVERAYDHLMRFVSVGLAPGR